MHCRFPAPVRAADEGGGGSPAAAPADPAAAAPADAPAAPADAAPAAPGTLLTGDPAGQPPAAAPAEGQQPGDAKPGEGKPAEGKEGDGKPPALTVESYGGLKLPEDLPITNPEGLAAFKGLFAELGISPEAAQKLTDLNAEQHRKAFEAQKSLKATAISEWSKEAAADKEFGGEAFAANAGIARQAFRAFASPALVDLFNQTGIGNHPEVLRAFFRVGKAMAEDGRVASGDGAKGDRLAALYPTMVSKE